jgi:hypothetical protein
MPGLKLNGVDVPVLADAVSASPVIIQDKARAFDGTPRSTVRARKREWRAKLGPQTQANADLYRQLINGEGHAFSFDADAYSSKGLGPTVNTNTVIGNTGSSQKWGANRLALSSGGNGGIITWPTAYLTTWTAFVWYAPNGLASSYEHWVIRPSGGGNTFRNGVLNNTQDFSYWCSTVADGTGNLSFNSPDWNAVTWAATTAKTLGARVKPTSGANTNRFKCTTAGTTGGSEPTWPAFTGGTVTDGTVVWTNVGPLASVIDDAVIVPYVVPDSWVAGIYAEHAARAWAPLPRLRTDGDMVLSGPILTLGEVGETDVFGFSNAGSWVTNGESPSFVLSEV